MLSSGKIGEPNKFTRNFFSTILKKYNSTFQKKCNFYPKVFIDIYTKLMYSDLEHQDSLSHMNVQYPIMTLCATTGGVIKMDW